MLDLIFSIKTLAILIVFAILLFLIVSEIRKIKNKKILNENTIRENKKEKKEIDAIELLSSKLEELPTRDEDIIETDENNKLLSQLINSNSLSLEDENCRQLTETEFEQIGSTVQKKLGPIIDLVKVIDEKDGSIILDMVAIGFITGAHIPIITPQGKIRVINFLTLEEEILLAIENNKPIFSISDVNGKKEIKKIERKDIEKILINESEKELLERLEKRENRITELEQILNNAIKEREKLVLTIEEQKNKLSESNAKVELLKELRNENTNTKQIETVENSIGQTKQNLVEVQDLNHKKQATITVDNSIGRKVKKEEINNVEILVDISSQIEDKHHSNSKNDFTNNNSILINEQNKIDNKLTKNSIQNDSERMDNSSKKSVNVIQDEQNINIQENLKKINKTNLKNVVEAIKAFLLSDIVLNKIPSDVKDIFYVSSQFIDYAKLYNLFYNFGTFKVAIKKLINDNKYMYDDESFELCMSSLKYKVINDAYFNDKTTKECYKSNFIQIPFTEDELLGLSIFNSKFSEIYTQNEIENKLNKEQRPDKQKLYRKRLEDIKLNNFKELV